MNLSSKVAIVTGAASGIGRAIAERLAGEGARVVVADINLRGANQVVDRIKAGGGTAAAKKADVTRSADVNQMVKTVLDEFGGIDILVNNAGGTAVEKTAFFWEAKEEVWNSVIDLNLKGTLICTRAVINHMIQKRSGKIINISSGAGIRGIPKQVDYSAAKAGVIGFTKSLAKEAAPFGVYVNCVAPGPIDSPALTALPADRVEASRKRVYLGRLGKPEEIANMVAFLASDEASFIVGQTYSVCGGVSLGF